MSFLASFTKKSKLDAAVKKAAKARSNEDSIADQLLKEVYQDYADVLSGDSLRAETLYRWGVTLLHQAKSKTPPESINIFRNAIAKFSFCMTIDPNYLAAAIDAGVACMDLARARGVPATDELYEMAKRQFDKANSLQAGVAAFNLACVHGVRGEHEACLETMKIAKENGNLPDDAEILADPDLANVIGQDWFKEFMAALEEDRKIAEEKRIAAKLAEEEAKKPKKPRNMDGFDPYSKSENNAEEISPEADVAADKPKQVDNTPKQAETKIGTAVETTATATDAESAVDNPAQNSE